MRLFNMMALGCMLSLGLALGCSDASQLDSAQQNQTEERVETNKVVGEAVEDGVITEEEVEDVSEEVGETTEATEEVIEQKEELIEN